MVSCCCLFLLLVVAADGDGAQVARDVGLVIVNNHRPGGKNDRQPQARWSLEISNTCWSGHQGRQIWCQQWSPSAPETSFNFQLSKSPFHWKKKANFFFNFWKSNLFRWISMASPHSNICGGKPRVVVASPGAEISREEIGLEVIDAASTCSRHLLTLHHHLTGPPVKDWAIWVRKWVLGDVASRNYVHVVVRTCLATFECWKGEKRCYPVENCKGQSPSNSDTAAVVVRVGLVPGTQVVQCVLEPEGMESYVLESYDVYPSIQTKIH